MTEFADLLYQATAPQQDLLTRLTASLDHDTLREFLTQRGWTFRREEDAREIWTREKQTVYVPIDRSYADYSKVLRAALSVIAYAEWGHPWRPPLQHSHTENRGLE